MTKILHMIIENFQRLDDIISDPISRRFTILEICAKLKVSNLLLHLGLKDLIHNMFHHFLVTIKEHHDINIFSTMESIMISCIDGMDVISQPIISML